ncbi:MAG: hypothetical protein QNJ70_03405 [Xenococcaceae cyanobacterium MO_207.B15]|nr:hypothetical protein [Xenococcaceae cyanobacterium MO_207.B15]MDJ0745166.1 hypothetical protein [Xenococcaceae cyanobacterium MO_167.B27]
MKKKFLIPLIICLAVTSVHAQEQIQGKNSDSEDHKILMIAEGQPVPSIDLLVYEDSVQGWNLEFKLNNFEFAPEMVNEKHNPNKGYANLYVNGERTTRIYSNWYHLGNLPFGRNKVKVILNTNSHQSLMYQGKLIEDEEIIYVY